MKRIVSCILSLLIMCLLVFSMSNVAQAEEYHYTVRIFLANADGVPSSFSAQAEKKVIVTSTSNGSDFENTNAVKAVSGDVLTISNLSYNDRINISNISEVVNVANGDTKHYYIKGIRLSGQNTKATTYDFPVTQDQDYVIAYGVGEVVKYIVKYKNADGSDLVINNKVVEDQIFYAPAGEKVYVAYKYFEGYIPNTYNYGQTIVKPYKDADGNEVYTTFTFKYAPGTPSITNTEYTSSIRYEGGGTSLEYQNVPGQTTIVSGGDADGGNQVADGGNAADGANQVTGNGAADNGAGEAIGDNEVPTSGPEEIIDIDDTQTPTFADRVSDNIIPIIAFAIVIVAIIAIVVALIVNRKRSKVTEASESSKEE